MKLQEYLQNSQRTCPKLGSLELDNAHMVYGMVSEIEELEEAIDKGDNVGVAEEVSDIMWYLSNWFRINGISEHFDNVMFPEVYNKSEIVLKLTKVLSKLCDKEKRELAYKKKFEKVDRIKIGFEILRLCVALYSHYNLHMGTALQNNIDKLKKRYPHSFDESLALNRDLDAERKELEK